ncbi:tetratricopeptide repeat protein, partial [bacterium]|nr:tetratricopeptide repeat protein [bacterium]
RGEIQLSTGINPAVAQKTFQHLVEKYPSYQYLDNVEFRIAWTFERRMKRYVDAAKSYEAFVNKYGFKNVWSDDVVANLVGVYLDHVRDFPAALRWSKIYREKFPMGHMAQHVSFYEARALKESGKIPEAQATLNEAITRFGDSMVPIYDSEDTFVDLVPFV